MAKSDVKELRKQLKNVAKDLMPEIFKTEAVEALEKKLSTDQHNKLSSIEDYVNKELARSDKRAKDVLGFIMREVKFNISNQLNNAYITMLAWQELMQERLGMSNDEFNAALDAKKLEVDKRLQEDAEKKQQEEIQAASSKQVQAEAQASAENKGPESDSVPAGMVATSESSAS